MQRLRGFTLIELIMIIVILGILATVAIPKYFDLQNQAKTAAEKGIVGGVRSGIATYYGNECAKTTGCAYPGAPTYLGGSAAACSTANPCFGNVLTQPVTSDWTCTTAGTVYTAPTAGANTNTYTYYPTGVNAGTFTCTSGTCL